MLERFHLEEGKLVATQNQQQAFWIHTENPTEEEISAFQAASGIPEHILEDALDEDEMSHMDMYGQCSVFFIDVPVTTNASPLRQTRPLCIIVSKEQVFSFIKYDCGFLEQLRLDYSRKIEKPADLCLVLIWNLMSLYIKSIKKMEQESNWGHEDFKNPSKKENVFFELLDKQKTMIEYETSIEANHLTIEKLRQFFEKELTETQLLLVDNLLLESQQISQMCKLFSDTLMATAGIAESIVSNNLNDVMKTLTSLTIICSIPPIISGIYMTNTIIPEPYNHFLVPITLSLSLALITWLVFKRKKML